VKDATRRSYTTQLKAHLVPAFGPVPLRDLTRARVKRFLAEKLKDYKARGQDGTACRLMYVVLSLVLESVVEDQLIVVNPVARLGKKLKLGTRHRGRSERIKSLTRAERDRFLAAAREHDPWLWRLWAVHVLGGYRPSELYALRESDLHLDDPKPTVRIERGLDEHTHRIESSPKGNASRSVDLSAVTVQLLRAHLAWRKEEKLRRGWRDLPVPLFFAEDGGYLRARAVRERMRQALTRAGLPAHFTPHALRHTYASLALDAGKDVYYISRMLGHASISMTADTYARWLPANRHGELDCLDPALGAL
jgi:integrase